MKNVLIGIFETPTKAYVKIEDDKGNLLGKGTCGPINLYLSVDQAWNAIIKATEIILHKSLINLRSKGYNFHAGLGLQHTEYTEQVRLLINKNKTSRVFKTFIVKSDCYALALTQKLKHAVIIVDEGIVGNTITKKGIIQAGGWGFPFADKGGILWLGIEAYRSTLQWIDGTALKSTPLLRAIYKHFNKNLISLVNWAMGDFLNQRGQYRIISDIVLKFYELQDEIAVALIQQSANEVVKICETIKRLTRNQNIAISLYGELTKYVTPLLPPNIIKNLHIIYDGTLDFPEGALNLLKLPNLQMQNVWRVK